MLQGSIILVNENGYLQTCLVVGGSNDAVKAISKPLLASCQIISVLSTYRYPFFLISSKDWMPTGSLLSLVSVIIFSMLFSQRYEE